MELSATTVSAVPPGNALPSLPARQGVLTRRLLGVDRALLHELARAVGGPFHVVFPQAFDDAAEAFQAVLGEERIDGRIYYAKKANKAACWVRRCAETGLGVDVASVGELRGALGGGVRGEQIVVTGPAKSVELHRLAALHGCLLTVDALDELARLTELGGRYGVVRVLLRAASHGGDSRFGLTADELDTAVGRCRDASAAVRLEGFGFHLASYAPAPRTELAASMLDLIARARAVGLPALCVDIGGGFTVNYVNGPDWQGFAPALHPETFHAGRSFAEFYPYHSPMAGADMLRAVLHGVPSGRTDSLATMLRAAEVTLLCEPGRALLDQAGVTVLRVQGVKDRGHGIVTVDGTSLSLSEQWFDSEFLPDPVLLPGGPSRPDGPVFPACVAGVSCLESDLLSWRKIAFPRRPEIGDLLVYLNTAGYQMDSNESPFHDLPLPPKIVVGWVDGAARWEWDNRG